MEKFLNKIVQGDCLELLKQIPDESVDLVVTDPPYGDGIGYGRDKKVILNNNDESINYKVIPELQRILKTGGVIYLFTNWKFSCALQSFVADKTNLTTRMQLVIVKNNIGMGYGFRNQYELCLVFEKGKATYNRNDVSNVLNMEHIHHDKDSHPHEKGIKMLEKIIDHSSKKNDIVLDCFAGSGSTLVACKNIERQFIGFELSEEYYQKAKLRLDSLTQSLF